MESVGSLMRAARLRLGLTLEQVSATTRISVNILQAIETDEPSRIGSAFLYKSFVRQFAEHVRLEIRHLEPALQAILSTIPEPLIPGQGVSLPKLPPLQASRPKRLRWLSSTASLLVMMLGCSGFYGMWKGAGKQTAPDRNRVARLSQQVRILHPVEVPLTPPDSTSAFRIELSALERTWLSAVADGRPAFSGILEIAETKVLEGHNSARIRTGNAGGVNVVFNGKPLGPLGERGQARTVVFTKDGYEVLQPAAHIALVEFTQIGE
ncbi:MAG: RodZ domain-containing protein [Bryobacteraceae bacterium]